jgi:hypothetical protein
MHAREVFYVGAVAPGIKQPNCPAVASLTQAKQIVARLLVGVLMGKFREFFFFKKMSRNFPC